MSATRTYSVQAYLRLEQETGERYAFYNGTQSLPSFKEYVLLRQDAAEALLFFREEPDVWRSSEATGLDQELRFRSIRVGLAMAAVYDRVAF